MRNNVAIIYSEMSRQAIACKAREEGRIYRFKGAKGNLQWIRGEAYLSVNGLASMLRRFAVKFDIVTEGECSLELLGHYHTVFCSNACCLSVEATENLQAWLGENRMLVVSGETTLPEQLLGIRNIGRYTPTGFCGIGWLPSLRFCPPQGDYILSPPQYPVRVVSAESGFTSLGSLIEYRAGEKICLDGDAIVIGERTIYFANPIFEHIGGILQGHISIESLRDRLGDKSNLYVDILGWYIKSILLNYGCKRLWTVQLRPWGKHECVLVLRHDTDASTDSSYLDYEIQTKTPATYAVLPDKNCKFYLSQIMQYPFLEAAYHFTSQSSPPFCRGGPSKRLITGKGLAMQVSKSKRCGIPHNTLHKHGNAFFYPETIDAMAYVYDSCPEVVGMGVMFRFKNAKYSRDKSLDDSYTVEHPNVSVPFCFPFKMVVAAIEGYKILRGWDIPHFIEPSPPLVDLVFNSASVLPNGVYMLGFHPAHARRDTFNVGGNFRWFLYAIDEARKRGWWIANYKTVCDKLNDWENLILNVGGDGLITLENPTAKTITDIVIYGEKVKGYINIPVVRPQTIVRIKDIVEMEDLRR